MNFYQLVGLKVMILKMCKLILFLHLHVPSYDAVLEGLGGQPWTFFLSHFILVASRVNWLGEQESFNILQDVIQPILC